MDTEQRDAIDIEVDEKLSENFKDHVSLANSVIPATMQEGEMKSKEIQKKESSEGECHIFNYQDFEVKRLNPRMGSEKDAMRLKHDFMQLNLEVHLHMNLSFKQTFDVLKKASRKDYSKKKYFVCCFLTHGKRDRLWAKDCSMDIDDILKIFSKSSSLKGIPKIFIFQACRGEEAEMPVSTDSTDSGLPTDTENYLDFLIINSTYLDTVSFKTEPEKVHGSFFIDEFCRSFEQFSRNLDFLEILTIVNFRMATIFLSHHKDNAKLDKMKQMPCFTSYLRKKIKFNRNIEIFQSSDTQYFDDRRKKHWCGSDSTNYPLSDIQLYEIKMAKKVLFLSVVDKDIGKNDSLVRCAVQLRPDFASRKYRQEEFYHNFGKEKILKFLDKSSNQSEIDCLICYIAAYSRYDSIHDSICDERGKTIHKKEIVEKFIGLLNKSFIGKPKIFIFLLCKSAESEKLLDEKFCNSSGRMFNDGTDSSDGENDQSINSIARGLAMNNESTDGGHLGENLIPIHADLLEICLTVSDWEHTIGPMNSFRDILEKSPTEDLLSLLTEFNCELVEKHNFYEKSEKSSFSVKSTLTKLLFLP